MPQTHKIVRDAVVALMSAPATGFNAQLATALPFYDVADPDGELSLDWNPAKKNVLYCAFSSADFNLSTLAGRLTLQITPGGSQFTGDTKGIKWSGIVGSRLVFKLRYSYSDGDEEPLEDDAAISIASAIEDAVIEVFQRRSINWGDFDSGSSGNSRCRLVYARPPDCPEGYQFEALGDGCQVVIPMSIGFKVGAEF